MIDVSGVCEVFFSFEVSKGVSRRKIDESLHEREVDGENRATHTRAEGTAKLDVTIRSREELKAIERLRVLAHAALVGNFDADIVWHANLNATLRGMGWDGSPLSYVDRNRRFCREDNKRYLEVVIPVIRRKAAEYNLAADHTKFVCLESGEIHKLSSMADAIYIADRIAQASENLSDSFDAMTVALRAGKLDDFKNIRQTVYAERSKFEAAVALLADSKVRASVGETISRIDDLLSRTRGAFAKGTIVLSDAERVVDSMRTDKPKGLIIDSFDDRPATTAESALEAANGVIRQIERLCNRVTGIGAEINPISQADFESALSVHMDRLAKIKADMGDSPTTTDLEILTATANKIADRAAKTWVPPTPETPNEPSGEDSGPVSGPLDPDFMASLADSGVEVGEPTSNA